MLLADKITFTVSVINTMITPYVLGAAPVRASGRGGHPRLSSLLSPPLPSLSLQLLSPAGRSLMLCS